MYLIYTVGCDCFFGEMVMVVVFLLMETEKKKMRPVSWPIYIRHVCLENGLRVV